MESNHPTGGLPRPAGFEDRMGHQTPAAPPLMVGGRSPLAAACLPGLAAGYATAMSVGMTWLLAVSGGQEGTPDEAGGIAIIAGVVVAVIVAFALIVWGFSAARRRWRTRPDETHRYGDVGRVAGAREAPPEERPQSPS
jgi:hypothetical protein